MAESYVGSGRNGVEGPKVAPGFGMLRQLADARGYILEMRANTHWQVCWGGKPLVDVWPSRGKYRQVDPPDAKEKSRVGTVDDVLRLADKLCGLKAVKVAIAPKADTPQGLPPYSGLSRCDIFAAVAMHALLMSGERDAEHVAEDAIEIADQLEMQLRGE